MKDTAIANKTVNVDRTLAPRGQSPARSAVPVSSSHPTRRFPDGLHVNRRSAQPIQDQIQAQIRYAIATGELKSGNPLPSINDLGERLGVNRNTVHQVYRNLRAAGLLDLAHGKGALVSAVSDSMAKVPGLSRLVERTLHSAISLGVSPHTFSRFLQSQAPAFDERFPLVAFVECNPYQTHEFAQKIADRWKMKVTPVLLSAVRKPSALPETCKLVLTTYFHYPELRKSLRRRDLLIRPIVVDVVTGLRKALRRCSKSSRVGLISRFDGISDVEEAAVEESRARNLDLRTFWYRADDQRRLNRFLSGLDVLICPDAARAALDSTEAPRLPARVIEWKASLDLAQLDSVQMSIPLVRVW